VRKILFSVAALTALISASAMAAEATFLGGATYTTAKDCRKLKALAAGGPRNIQTAPETLTAKGYLSWEGGCTIDKITAGKASNTWTVNLRCHEGAEENQLRTEVWTRQSDGSLMSAFKDEKTKYIACNAGKTK
jgi:hypothetical protein